MDEVARLVTRLVADATNFVKPVQQAMGVVNDYARTVDDAVKRATSSVVSLAGAAGGAFAAFGAGAWLKKVFDQFVQMEALELRLEAAIESNGGVAETTMKRYNAFADSIAAVTTTGRQATLVLLAQAEALGLGDQYAERAVKNAVTLAAVRGGEAGQYLRATALLEDGNARMLARSIPTLRLLKDAGAQAAAAQEFLAKRFSLAEAQAESLGGQIKRLGNDAADMSRQFAGIVGDAAKPFFDWLRGGASSLKNMSQETKVIVVSVVATVAAFAALPAVIQAASFALGVMGVSGALFLAAAVAIGVALGSWVNDVGGVSEAWEIVAEEALRMRDASIEALDAHKELVVGVVAGAVAVVVAVVAWKVLGLAVTAAAGLYALFHVQQIVGVALWLTWKVAVLAASAVLWVFNTSLALGKFLFAGNVLAQIAYGIGILAVKGAVWLLNAALAVLNVLLSPAVIFAAVVTVAALGAAYLVVAAAVGVVAAAAMALWESMRGVASILGSMPTDSGPLGAIRDVLGETYDNVKAIIVGMQTDMPLAVELAKASFGLLVERIKSLWPPLWVFIREGFEILWSYVAAVFEVRVGRQVRDMLIDPIGWTTGLNGVKRSALETQKEIAAAFDASEKARKEAVSSGADEASSAALKRTQEAFDELLKKFSKGESEAEKEMMEGVIRARTALDIAELEKYLGEEEKARAKSYQRQDAMQAQQITKQAARWQAAAAGSAEDLSRQQEYLARLQNAFVQPTRRSDAVASGSADAAEKEGKQLEFLERIANATEKKDRTPNLDIRPGDFAGDG